QFSQEQIDDLRHAATLIKISRHVDPDVLEKVARIAKHAHIEDEQKQTNNNDTPLDPLPRITRIIKIYNETLKPSTTQDSSMTQNAAILRLATEYSELTDDNANRRTLSPMVAKNLITRNPLAKHDHQMLNAFLDTFKRNRMEATPIILIQKLRRF